MDPVSLLAMLQDHDLLDEGEAVRGVVRVTIRPTAVPPARFGRPRLGEGVAARQRAHGDARVAFAGRVADVEGDEQVPGGIERVIHRSVRWDSHRGVRWDDHVMPNYCRAVVPSGC